jgi:hypothetical protein
VPGRLPDPSPRAGDRVRRLQTEPLPRAARGPADGDAVPPTPTGDVVVASAPDGGDVVAPPSDGGDVVAPPSDDAVVVLPASHGAGVVVPAPDAADLAGVESDRTPPGGH